jgi:transcriptional regulator with XRE-family HTH domain
MYRSVQMAEAPMLELFAGELRRMRMAAGLSQEALAEKINFSASLVAAVEQCRRSPRSEFTQQCDEALGGTGLLQRIRDASLREALVPWFRDWIAIEREARALRSFQPLVIPGLFQTPAYTRALCESSSPLPADEVEQIIATRMSRQQVLGRNPPPLLVAVVDQTVIERSVGGPRTMREQLLRLVELVERPNVHLHVVPKSAGAYPGLSGPFVIATPPEGSDVAFLDNQVKGGLVERAADIRSLHETWEAVRGEALPQRQSTAILLEAADQWT